MKWSWSRFAAFAKDYSQVTALERRFKQQRTVKDDKPQMSCNSCHKKPEYPFRLPEQLAGSIPLLAG